MLYRAGLTAAFLTLSDLGRCYAPEPEQLIRARSTLSTLRLQMGANVVVRRNEKLIAGAGDLLDRVAITGSAVLSTGDRDDARQFAKAMVKFIGEMEPA